MEFIPDQNMPARLEVPYFDDVRADDAPGYSTSLSVAKLQNEIKQYMERLGGAMVVFVPGTFPTAPPRYGYRITFSLNGTNGRIDIAALPLRNETARKKEQALRQALYLVRDWLKSEVYSTLFRPGAITLVPYLIGEGGSTIGELIIHSGKIPDLSGVYLPPVTSDNGGAS